MATSKRILGLLFVGVLIGIVGCYAYLQIQGKTTPQQADTKPLYWVAPMDANFRRDKPGLSPMGMALIPVYERNETLAEGVVKVSPEVINNLSVRTAKVQYKVFSSPIDAVGYVKYDESRLVHLHPRVSGWVDKMYVKTVGEMVVKGQPLYAIYSPELVNAQEEYLLSGALSQAAEEKLMALQMPLQAIEALKKTRLVQQVVTHYAPQSGVVEMLPVREGFFIEPGSNILAIADMTHVWVIAHIYERDMSKIALNDKAIVKVAGLSQQYSAKIDYIYPSLDSQTRTLPIRILVSNPDLVLKNNMFSQVFISPNNAKKRIVVPLQAVIRTGLSNRIVKALGEGKFKSFEVELGQVSGDEIEILSGINIDDEIVVSAQFLIDSESHIPSELARYENTTMDIAAMNQSSLAKAENSAAVNGVIKAIDSKNRLFTIHRDAIAKWQRPPITMDFKVPEELDLAQYHVGQKIHFKFSITGDNFIIQSLKALAVKDEDISDIKSAHHAQEHN